MTIQVPFWEFSIYISSMLFWRFFFSKDNSLLKYLSCKYKDPSSKPNTNEKKKKHAGNLKAGTTNTVSQPGQISELPFSRTFLKMLETLRKHSIDLRLPYAYRQPIS